MKILLITIVSALISVSAIAANKMFKSEGLSHIVAAFEVVSPELVKNGLVEVSYCGAYDAYTIFRKMTSKELQKNMILSLNGQNLPTESAYRALENLETETDITEFMNKIDGIVRTFYGLSIYELNQTEIINGIMYKMDYLGTLIHDHKTNEYLNIMGDYTQNDCD